MIENLFLRAWNIENEEMLEDSYFRNLAEVCLELVKVKESSSGKLIYENEKIIYMVSLGFKDSYDTLVFGGDILRIINNNDISFMEMSLDILDYIKDCERLSNLKYQDNVEIEIIGNIFEVDINGENEKI